MVLKYDAGAIAQRPERSYSFKNQSLIALANRLLRSVPADGEAKDGWKVNVADLGFRGANAVILLGGLGLSGFYLAALPRGSRRDGRTDAVEWAMLLLMIQAFNPLSFDYSFVWLLFPVAVALGLILGAPRVPRGALLVMGLAVALGVFALALPFHRTAQGLRQPARRRPAAAGDPGGWLMSGAFPAAGRLGRTGPRTGRVLTYHSCEKSGGLVSKKHQTSVPEGTVFFFWESGQAAGTMVLR